MHVLLDTFKIDLGSEIREGRIGEYEFGICRLPKQEIRKPLLTCRADDYIGVRMGETACIEMRRDSLLVISLSGIPSETMLLTARVISSLEP